jgi:hypothetical protein
MRDAGGALRIVDPFGGGGGVTWGGAEAAAIVETPPMSDDERIEPGPLSALLGASAEAEITQGEQVIARAVTSHAVLSPG